METKSPHILDLRAGRRLSRHAHDHKLNDVIGELNEGLKPQRPRVRTSRWTEGLRMMTIGVVTVFTLNIIGVYSTSMQLKEEVAIAARTSYESVVESGPQSDVFEGILSDFESIQNELWFIQNQRGPLQGKSHVNTSMVAVLESGESLTRAGESFLHFVEAAQNHGNRFFTPKVTGISVTNDLRQAYDAYFTPALNDLALATEKMATLQPKTFPADLQPILHTAQSELSTLTNVLHEFEAAFPLLMQLLGDEHPQRYLVLLENNHESRPGGGFIGSYLIVDVNDGHLQDLSFHDVYDLDNRFHEHIPPPAEISKLTNEWRFRDSNYSPDMRISAEKAAWFLDKEGGPSVDHVLTVDLTFVEELLKITGPIQVDSLPLPLASDNFSLILSYMVEAKLTGATTPKAILGEFIDAAQARLKEQAPWLEVGQLIQSMAREKHLSLVSADEDIHAFINQWGITGTLPAPRDHEDYFMLVHTSIGGNKTDRYISQNIEHRTHIERDGVIHNQVTVERTHHFNEQEKIRLTNLLASAGFTSIEPWLVDLLGNGANVSAMRLYVPHGTRLITSSGIPSEDIKSQYDADLDLDYFSFTSTVYPGRSETFTLTYELPSTLNFSPLDEYRLALAKQPGDTNTTFTKIITADAPLTHYRSFPEALIDGAHEQADGVYRFTTELTHDQQVGQLWGN